jgi:hypothetical protein
VWSHGSSANAAPVAVNLRSDETVGIHGEGLEHEWCRQRDRRPAEPTRRRVGGHAPHRNPHERRGRSADEREKGDDAWITEQRERRRDENRQARRVNGVDLPVDAAAEIVGLQRQCEILAIVAACVVVFDLQIAIAQQALRDDQIMRLIAVW